MELTEKTIQGAAKVLHHVVTSTAVKLHWGKLKRQMDRDAAAQGDNSESYRTLWLRATRDEVWEVLKKAGERFNLVYTHDRASIRDYMDVLRNIQYQLEEVVRTTR